MSNESKMLPKGFGMPFVKVTDSQNKVIIEPLSGLPIGTFITAFEYTYREEKDDECNITILTDNPNLVDIPQFREQQYLGVQWGLVYDDKSYIPSPPRKVMIRDTRLKFSNQGILLTLKCTDGFSITKSQQLAKNTDDNFVNWIQSALTNNFPVKAMIHDVKDASKANLPDTNQYRIGYSPTVGLDALSRKVSEWLGLREVSMDKLISTKTFMQVGRTPATALRDAVKYIPNGPYHVDGRDDGVTIHPTNFNQPPMASYTWHDETGEIISFQVNTRKKAKALDVAKRSQIDGETKSLDAGLTQTDGSLPDLSVDAISGAAIPTSYDSTVDGITGAAIARETEADQYKDTETTLEMLKNDKNILREKAPEYLEKVVNDYKAAENDPTKLAEISLSNYTVKVKTKVKETVNPEDYGSIQYSGSTPAYDRTTGWNKLKRDKTVQILKKPSGKDYNYWENPEVLIEKEFELQLSAKDLLGYAGDADSAKILAFNEVSDALQKQLEGSLVVIGQPNLQSSKIITINNISEKYSGDWYIKEVSHTIDSNVGYTSTLELIKKTVSNGTIVQSDTKVNTQSLAMKVQKIANELTDADIAKSQLIQSAQEKVLNSNDDYGRTITITNEAGGTFTILAEKDWVSRDKVTQTENINRNDKVLKDKLK